MLTILNQEKLSYVLYHLNHSIDISSLSDNLIYDVQPTSYNNKIIFSKSVSSFHIEKIISIDNLPILFPVNNHKKWYTIDRNKNLVFHHDLLKSAFYLLSEYQIYETENAYDHLGRFKYNESIQYNLNIINKPIVNYYFEIIAQGIEEYCKIHHLPFNRKKIFDHPFCFNHSHDVDRIDQYHFWEVALKILQFLGKKPHPYKDKKTLKKITFDYILNFLKPKNSENDFWNFTKLRNIERNLGIRSVFYFLDKEGLHDNARYRFTDPRITNLIRQLNQEKCEIALHGTIQSADDLTFVQKGLKNLQQVAPQQIVGNRQHYLKLKVPKTYRNLEKVGITYDSTAGFAEHEGFRNSYCLPYKPYDFQNDRIIEIWEIPLNVMDVTLLEYRKLDFETIMKSSRNIITEVKKFGGVYTSLWHNCRFDEQLFPGIYNFYQEFLTDIMLYKPVNMTGIEIVEHMENISKHP